MAKAPAITKGRSKSAGSASAPADAPIRTVGPPLLILALGFVSFLVSLALLSADDRASHVIGYLTGAMVPIVVVGLVRRIDLERRRSPYYQVNRLLRPGLVALAVVAVVAAALHVWPLATDLAS